MRRRKCGGCLTSLREKCVIHMPRGQGGGGAKAEEFMHWAGGLGAEGAQGGRRNNP
ncbi:hypothetical protein ACP70R_001508 [Stipagrostis hirtigluma subsp. patula]